jgi:hypothetical protein
VHALLSRTLIPPAAVEPAPAPTSSRRRFLLTGAALGVLTGAVARLWMRAITSQEPVLSVGGTGLILLVFAGMGALSAWALYLRRTRTRRPRTIRAIALAPYALLGPFMPLFLPGLLGAALVAHPRWRRTLRWPILTIGGLLFAFVILIFAAGEDMNGPGWARVSLYLAVAYAVFATNRIALEPFAPRGEAPPQQVVTWDPAPVPR